MTAKGELTNPEVNIELEKIVGSVAHTDLRHRLARLPSFFQGYTWPVPLSKFRNRVLTQEAFSRALGFTNPGAAEHFLDTALAEDTVEFQMPAKYERRQLLVSPRNIVGFAALAITKEQQEWEEGRTLEGDELWERTRAMLGLQNPAAEVLHPPSEGNKKVANEELKAYLADHVEDFISRKLFPLPYLALYHSPFHQALEITDRELSKVLRGLYSDHYILQPLYQDIGHRTGFYSPPLTSSPYVDKNRVRAISAFVWTAKQKLGSVDMLLSKTDEKYWYSLAKVTKDELGESVIATVLDHRTFKQRNDDRYTKYLNPPR